MKQITGWCKEYSKHIILYVCIVFFLNQISQAQVTASFTADSTSGCDFLELNLINLSTGATDYIWQVFDSGGELVGTSVLENPSFFLTGTGSYTVVLTASGPGGSDVLSIADFANIYTPPDAVIDAPVLSGCAPITLTFNDASVPGGIGSISERYWVISGAPSLPEDVSVNYTFTEEGTYTIYLFIGDDAGCSDFTTETINIYAETVAAFSSSDVISCITPFTVSFTNLSTGTAPLSYLWNFGDGTTSTAASPSHTYTDFGSYTVGLSVSNIYGCSDLIVLNDYVQISPSPSVDFTPSSTSICAGTTVTFDNISASASATWTWDFGDGTTSTLFEPTHTYTADGTYTVTLTGDFGAGCIGAITYADIITVNSAPTVSIGSTDASSVCELPFTVSYVATVSGGPVIYAWTFEDAAGSGTSSGSSPDYTYTTVGTYDVSLTVTNGFGCTATDFETDYVNIGTLTLNADFLPVNGCVPLVAEFGVTAGEELVSYSWDLGNGSTSTDATPFSFYTDTGCYTISVTATSVNGCTSSATFSNYVCVGDTSSAFVTLADTSCPTVAMEVLFLPLDSIVVNVDGGLDEAIATSVDSTTFISLTEGDHALEIITWNYGCPDTTFASIHILDVADSNLVVIYDCTNPYQVQFFIDNELAEQSCGWVWNFGDDTEDSINMNPIHIYDAPGSYDVTITYNCITEEECEGNGLTATVTIPVASFTPGSSLGCTLPYTVTFTNNSTDSAANDLLYFWDFGDGGTSTDLSPTYTYNTYGIFPVELLIMDIHDCTDTFYDTVIVSSVTAAYTSSDYGGCVPYNFTLNNSSVSAYGEITTYIINWDDGVIDTFYNASDVASVTHNFSVEGFYYVSLSVVNEYGCSETYTDTIIASDPFSDFSVNDTFPCVGQEVYLNELASGIGLTYFWNFGDGTNSAEANPSHTYSTLGSFTIGLIVTDTNGCTDLEVKPVFIETDSAVFDFNANVLVANCNYALIQFNALPEDSVCTYYWEFGDGGNSVEANPIYPYIAAGVYSVSLTITNCNGCVGYLFKEGFITVPGPYGEVTVSEDTLCTNDEIMFTIQIASADSITLYLDNGDAMGLDVDYSDTPTVLEVWYNYNTPGTFLPSIVAVDTSGCFSVIPLNDTIHIGNYPIADFSVSENIFCVGNPITLTDNSTGMSDGDIWTWDIAVDTFTYNTSTSFNYIFTVPGNYNLELITETIFGCADSVSSEIEVLAYPVVTITEDTTICPGFSVPLQAAGSDFYTWTPADYLSDPFVPNPVATPLSTTTYIVNVSNGYCSVIDSITIEVADNLIFDAGPDTGFCIGEEIQLYSLFFEGVDSALIDFFWTPETYLSDAAIYNPLCSALENITYTVVASCGILVDTALVQIEVEELPDIEIWEDTILIIQGQSVPIVATLVGGTTPTSWVWEPAVAVDCPSCQAVMADPQQSAIFSCTAYTDFRCSDVDFVYVKVRTCDESLFYLPNIITPNNDGYNDVFKFKYEGLTAFKTIRIFDRWGRVMFETTDPENTWNGTYNGVIVDPGVYVYAIDIICINGEYGVVTGNITLIR